LCGFVPIEHSKDTMMTTLQESECLLPLDCTHLLVYKVWAETKGAPVDLD